MYDPAKLVDIGGRPAIFYVRLRSSAIGDPVAYDLRYVRGIDKHGESWSESVALGPANAVLW